VESRQIPPTRPQATPLPTVLYIGGYGRSGSTLVGRILGEAPDTVCVGETRYLWSRGLLHNVECGCGQPFRSCHFWNAVGEEAFGGWNQVDTEHLVEMDRALAPLRTLPFHWMPSLRRDFATALDEYVLLLTRLYAAIACVSGTNVIIDTSKEPHFASLLTRMPHNDVRIIHLVRDSRAVAYSWTRNKQLPSAIGDEKFMPRFKPASTGLKWLAWNIAFHALTIRPTPYIRINYESFVENPRKTLQDLNVFAEESPLLPSSQLTDSKVKLGSHHMFSGNPMRAKTGWLDMHLDDEWQTMQPTSQFAKVTAITWPLLRFYGYPAVPAARRNALYPKPRYQRSGDGS
jgi:hypothetical protein